MGTVVGVVRSGAMVGGGVEEGEGEGEVLEGR